MKHLELETLFRNFGPLFVRWATSELEGLWTTCTSSLYIGLPYVSYKWAFRHISLLFYYYLTRFSLNFPFGWPHTDCNLLVMCLHNLKDTVKLSNILMDSCSHQTKFESITIWLKVECFYHFSKLLPNTASTCTGLDHRWTVKQTNTASTLLG